MTLIRLTDAQLHELMQAARIVPPDLRDVFLERVAAELQGKPLGDGLVHRVAYNVARDHVGSSPPKRSSRSKVVPSTSTGYCRPALLPRSPRPGVVATSLLLSRGLFLSHEGHAARTGTGRSETRLFTILNLVPEISAPWTSYLLRSSTHIRSCTGPQSSDISSQ